MNNGRYHPTALVESDLIGELTRVWAFAHVLPGARIGRNCNIGDHVYVESGAVVGDNVTIKNQVCIWEGMTLEDEVFVGPCVTFANDRFPRSPRMIAAQARYADKHNWLLPTVLERGCSIGANATILPGVRIGQFSFIAAGSTVTTNVEPFSLVIGSPARKVGMVCHCGRKRNSSEVEWQCPDCGTVFPVVTTNS